MTLRVGNWEYKGKSNAVSLRRALLNLSEDLQVDVRVYCIFKARKIKTLSANVYQISYELQMF